MNTLCMSFCLLFCTSCEWKYNTLLNALFTTRICQEIDNKLTRFVWVNVYSCYSTSTVNVWLLSTIWSLLVYISGYTSRSSSLSGMMPLVVPVAGSVAVAVVLVIVVIVVISRCHRGTSRKHSGGSSTSSSLNHSTNYCCLLCFSFRPIRLFPHRHSIGTHI